MEATIQKWGNSNAVRFPKSILGTAGIKENDTVQILARKNEIIVRKARKHKTWDERFEGYAKASDTGEYDSTSVGEERFWESE